jgi:hypothetical protein
MTLRPAAIVLALAIAQPVVSSAAPRQLVVSSSSENDLYKSIAAGGRAPIRRDTPAAAIEAAPEGGAVLILADGYPAERAYVPLELYGRARSKRLRLYVEYPSHVPALELGATRQTSWSRGVVASDAFGASLPRLRILGLHDCHFLPITLPGSITPHLVLARVAGFDSAVYGLPETDVHPMLFEHPAGDVLVGATALSHFVTGRYAPVEAWPNVWWWILSWLVEEGTPPKIVAVPAVKPSFTREADLPAGAGRDAFRRGVKWFSASGLLMHPSWNTRWAQAAGNKEKDGVDRGMPAGSASGDGSEGILEGFSSRIEPDGSQPVRWHRRADCIGETSGAFGVSCALDRNQRDCGIAERLNDYLYFRSEMGTGPRIDPSSASNGLLGWSLPMSPHVYYGDDNARALLGTIVAAASTRSSKWDERILRTIVGNFRTTGRLGFRGNRLEEGPLQKDGWRTFFESERVNYAPHYESYLWALYLWAYDKTRYGPFLERAKSAIGMTVAAYPDQWRWTNGIQQERARMLLPLSWLVRVEDTPEHRRWLATIARDLLALQDASGAIREEIGSAGRGRYGPPKSNAAYGTAEAPLIQTNGDPLTDLLYTSNFAFLGLHEAAAATGEATYRDAAQRLADYVVRIQARSTRFPEFDGAWFRAFDYRRWDYWASNADHGWGAWSVETGWTQAWLSTVLGLRELKTSVWELTSNSQVAKHAAVLIPSMLEVP